MDDRMREQMREWIKGGMLDIGDHLGNRAIRWIEGLIGENARLRDAARRVRSAWIAWADPPVPGSWIELVEAIDALRPLLDTVEHRECSAPVSEGKKEGA